MKVEVLFFDGCPNHKPTVELVHDVVREIGVDVSISEVEVRSAEDAKRLRFLGSPTVHVEGVDIEVQRANDSGFAISCRMYGSSGVPPRELIVAALTGGAA